jgi:repressor LexA
LTVITSRSIIENISDQIGGRMGYEPRYPGLTGRQQDIISFFTDHARRNDYPPTLREIGDAVGLKSASSVSYQVRELQRKGYLSREGGRPRTTTLRQPAVELAPQAQPWPGEHEHEHEQVPVQVIGRIAAGGPISAVDLAEEYVYVPASVAGAHGHFALEVVGDSMIGKAIIDGDRVVVRCNCEVRNGDTVVARFDSDTSPEGVATLKTFKRAGGHVWLMPENPAYDPILGDDAKIVGKVVYTFRSLC